MGVFGAVFAALSCGPARAALDCDQLVAVAQTTLSLRDQGASLSAVMSEIERGDLRQTLTAQELNLLRQIVRLSFTSEVSVREIFESCQAGELGLPKPKP
jgi:hypothetical protein